MQLSYSVIKENYATNGQEKKISTQYVKKFKAAQVENMEDSESDVIANYEELIKNYENIAGNILKKAKMEAETIRVEAIEKANALEKEVYERAYREGKSNGYEDGKSEAISQVLPQAKAQAEEKIVMAESILKYAKGQYEEYLFNKKNEVLSLSYSIAQHILKHEIAQNDGFSKLVEQVLEDSKGEENIIIKCNPIHEEEISSKLILWKNSYAIRGEIFILPNPAIPEGNAVIEKDSGVMEVGVDVALNIIREEMFS
ncbi:MAG: FliH/SctL family protein [Clostridium sp.]